MQPMTDPNRHAQTTVVVASATPIDIARQGSVRERAAAVTLATVMILGLAKLIVGLAIGSLALVADAMHSGLDFVAAVLTLLAVRWASRPPDADHPYGHGRAENLSALVQALLLVAVAIGIGVEAVERIASNAPPVQPGPVAFIVILVSMALTYWRARVSRNLGAVHDSAALRAAGTDLSTDVWSAAVVLVGLAAVTIRNQFGGPAILGQADAIAALAVATFVLIAAARLAHETIDALVDRSPENLAYAMADAVSAIPGVIECRRVRLRRVGNYYYADVVAVAPRTVTLEASHQLSDDIEQSIRRVEPRTDVVVHLEPGISEAETVAERIELVARQVGVHVHDIRVHRVNGRLSVNLHVEVPPNLSLDQAHALASDLEQQIAEADERIQSVNTHVETEGPSLDQRLDVTRRERRLVRDIEALADNVLGGDHCHDVRIYDAADPTARPASDLDVILHCHFPAETPVTLAHEEAERLERALRERFTYLGSILVHVEPEE